MKISISSYSFYQYIAKGKMTQSDCVSKAHEIGFEAIEFIDIDGENLDTQLKNAETIRKEAEKYNMTVNAYAIGASLYHDDADSRKKEIERIKGQLHVADELGAKVMRHDTCPTLGTSLTSKSFDRMLPYLAESSREITEYAQTLGIVTCTENHGLVAQDSDRVERLFNSVNHENFGLLVDIGNFLCVDENPIIAVSRVAPYAVHAHAKDMYVRREPSEGIRLETRGCNYLGGAVIGEGDVPVKQCIKILKKAGYDGFLSIEYEANEDCITGITRGFKNLKKYISQV